MRHAKLSLWLLPAACFLFGAAGPEVFLSPSDAVRVLADGKPWNGRRPNGEQVRITFNPDGTGRFAGPLTLSMTWSVRADAVCIDLGLVLGTKCVRFGRLGAGLQAFEDGEPLFVLSR